MTKNLLDRYLLTNLWVSFLPLFGALFMIASLIVFVQLAAMTSLIKVSFMEMIALYLMQTPQIVLYILPVVFFASIMLSLARLSSDLETTVFFSLKASLWQVMRPYAALSFVLAIAIFALGFVVAPKAKIAQRAFLYGKQDSAKLNIRASEFGQRFGDWMVFVGSQSGEGYGDIALYSIDKARAHGFFVLAESVATQNESGLFSLQLKRGRGYEIGAEKLREMEFETMSVNQVGKLRELSYDGLIEYWKSSKTREIVWVSLCVLFTLFSLPATLLGIHHPRLTKSYAGVLALGLGLLFYAPAMVLGDFSGAKGYYAFVVPPVWFLITLVLIRRRLKTY
ncbi:membrane protein [Campylobacterota bacterium]|nr:membrane protein [Campylobacterota bacterium]